MRYQYKSIAEIVEEVFVTHDKAANREQSRLLVLYLAKILAEQERRRDSALPLIEVRTSAA